jgi:hypothetical protein
VGIHELHVVTTYFACSGRRNDNQNRDFRLILHAKHVSNTCNSFLHVVLYVLHVVSTENLQLEGLGRPLRPYCRVFTRPAYTALYLFFDSITIIWFSL